MFEGVTYDSKAEAKYAQILKFMERSGAIKILERQPKVYLTEARILVKPDFLIQEDGEKRYIDVKGYETSIFRIKKRLWKFYAEHPLYLVDINGKLIEIVTPKPR